MAPLCGSRVAPDWRAFEAVVVSRYFYVRSAGNRLDPTEAGASLPWLWRFRSADHSHVPVQPVRNRTVLTA
jgi:hypothetical protein